MRYKYIGETKTFIPRIGEIEPAEVIETDIEISNPLFIKEEKQETKKKGEKNS